MPRRPLSFEISEIVTVQITITITTDKALYVIETRLLHRRRHQCRSSICPQTTQSLPKTQRNTLSPFPTHALIKPHTHPHTHTSPRIPTHSSLTCRARSRPNVRAHTTAFEYNTSHSKIHQDSAENCQPFALVAAPLPQTSTSTTSLDRRRGRRVVAAVGV